MTTFKRRGHLRTSANGKTVWVEGHYVERDDWERISQSTANARLFFSELTRLRADHRLTPRFVNPNASCPQCGQPVFFYQNERGSRVYFDELGPPWPKHPCTNNSAYFSDVSGQHKIITPEVREIEQMKEVKLFQQALSIDPVAHFRERFKGAYWPSYRIVRRFNTRNGWLLALDRIDLPSVKMHFVFGKGRALSLSANNIVFLMKRQLSYFDQKTFAEKSVKIEQFSSTGLFVKHLFGLGAQ